MTRVDDQLSLWVEEHTDATHVLLCGPCGVGKSRALSVVAEQFTREEFERAGDMVDGLPRIVTHDERVGGIRFTTVRAAVIQAYSACPREVVIIDDEHDGFLGTCAFKCPHASRLLDTPSASIIQDIYSRGSITSYFS